MSDEGILIPMIIGNIAIATWRKIAEVWQDRTLRKQLVAVFSEGASWRVGRIKEPKDKT